MLLTVDHNDFQRGFPAMLRSGHAIADDRHPGAGSGVQVLPSPSPWPVRGYLPCQGDYDIRPVRTDYQHGLANMLVRRMYSWRGYDTTAISHRPNEQNRVTLAVWQSDEIIATLTLGRDSRQHGLLADALYGEEVDRLRRPGRVVCEVSKLAVDPDFSSKDLLIRLFRSARQYAEKHFAASDAVIEVNPRHVSYYQRWLGFRQLGNLRHCLRVDAPAILLHQSLEGFNSLVLPI